MNNLTFLIESKIKQKSPQHAMQKPFIIYVTIHFQYDSGVR